MVEKLPREVGQASEVRALQGDHRAKGVDPEEDAAPLGDVLLHPVGRKRVQNRPTGERLFIYLFSLFLFSSAYSGCCVDARTRVFTQVKSQKTVPIVYGRVGRFLLYGEHKGSVFATGGEVEVLLVRRESS